MNSSNAVIKMLKFLRYVGQSLSNITFNIQSDKNCESKWNQFSSIAVITTRYDIILLA